MKKYEHPKIILNYIKVVDIVTVSDPSDPYLNDISWIGIDS